MKTLDATPSLIKLTEAWRESVSQVLTDAGLHALVVETIDAPSCLDKIAKMSGKHCCFALGAAGGLRGTLRLLMSESEALQLRMVPPPEAAPESTPHGASAEILNQAAKRVADVWGIGLAESAIAATAVDEDPELVCGGLRVGAENFTPITIVLCPSADFVESLQAQEEGSLAAGLGEEGSAALANPFQGPSSNLDLLFDVQLEATIRFGGRQLLLREILSLSPGSAIGLDRQIDEPAELLVAGRLVARGQVVVVDGNFGLRITDVTSARQRSELLHA